MTSVPEIFGSMVFNDSVMKERLPHETYKAMHKAIQDGESLDITIANVVANAMKDWAIEKGATHYTHWFQPMTGITAEKHDSFISPTKEGTVIMEFSGKELIKGEPDASSFPSGGLRATAEARGYTAWDPTSYAFIKDKCLCIPTAFCSYTGEALDKKTPLLRSMAAINKQALRILKLFGDESTSVKTTVGPEQEYFLIDKSVYEQRKDLIYTGRTLFGVPAPKGQEMDDHYFGVIKPRVQAFMNDLNEECWKLGILSKTEHNEVAPAQHELAPIFSTTNIATDHNQILMELLQKVAKRHGMVCLLHEKPFDGVNGSGKHNNWSISTDTANLLEPGDTPDENAKFLIFLTAVIKAVDEYQDLLRLSVASAGNDHRLGANEAPPAIVSMFIGEELQAVLDSIESGVKFAGRKKVQMTIGVDVLPKFPKDTTDRNRTSPFAFTGNKFEFRMVGSADSIACANIMINTAVAEELRQFADELEKASDFKAALNDLIKRVIKEHKRIIFNGNGYDDAWVAEAEKRGLLNLKTTPEALAKYTEAKNLKIFELHEVFTEAEVKARQEILLENYAKLINIEAITMMQMARKSILPAVTLYSKELAETVMTKKSAVAGIDCSYEEGILKKIAANSTTMVQKVLELEEAQKKAYATEGEMAKALAYKDNVIPLMAEVRKCSDTMEKIVSKKFWPFPTYGDILFSVK